MGQDTAKIEAMYDTVAKEWAEKFSGEHERKPKDREMLAEFAREIGKERPVWDLGCGPGDTAAYLKGLGVDVAGLDLSEKLLEQARALHPDIRFQKGDILDLEWEDSSIAGIVAFYAIVHFAEEQVGRAFAEIFRVLKPGGPFLFTFHIGDETMHLEEFLGRKVDIDFMFFTTEFISACLKRTGFEIRQIVEREPYPGVEYESRRAYVFAGKPR